MKHTHCAMSEMHCVLYIAGMEWYRPKGRGVGITVIRNRSDSKGYIQYDAGRIAFPYCYRGWWRMGAMLET